MIIKILKEEGYKEAMVGIGLSYGLTSDLYYLYDSLPEEIQKRLHSISLNLAFKDGGENKFLRMMNVWIDITAPWYLWKQIDTYKIGTTAQSESSMHTITKKYFGTDNFETLNMDKHAIEYYLVPVINTLNSIRDEYLDAKDPEEKKRIWYRLISLLPSSFLQRRIVSMNYAVLQNIILNRRNHKLDEWKRFCTYILRNIEYPEYLSCFG